MIQKIFSYVILLISCSGCSTLLKPINPRQNAMQISTQYGFQKSSIQTQSFILSFFSKPLLKSTQEPLTIYIEGDGHAWVNRYQISNDPTPHNPLALKLAVLDPSPKVVYLARPCQYTEQDRYCHPTIWTDERFSEAVIASMNEGVEYLKKKYHAPKIHLVGFSGGAAVAILIAARRKDIASIRTVAGDLDHEALSAYHKTTPLKGSLNPKSMVHKIAHIPQYHFVGDNDPVVPVFLSETFVCAVNAIHAVHTHKKKRAISMVLKGVTHHEGWEERWPTLLQTTTPVYNNYPDFHVIPFYHKCVPIPGKFQG